MKETQEKLDTVLQENRRRSSDRPSTLEANGFFVQELIGRGTFSTVKKAYWLKKKKNVAIKIMSKSNTSDTFMLKYAPRELDIIRTVQHDNIIKFYEVIETTMRFYIIMDYAEKGSLLNLLREKKTLAESRVRTYYSQLIDAIEYIHKAGIVHRDIKCENVVLDSQDHVKLIDFGFACRLWDQKTGQLNEMKPYLSQTFCGSHAYASPEILVFKPYNPIPADVWSSGVVLYALLFGRLPFTNGKDPKVLLKLIANGAKFPSDVVVSDNVQWLLNKIFVPATERMTVAQIRRFLRFCNESDGKSQRVHVSASKRIKLNNKN
ncbi:testis-specific serine/threonine-protein kinase 3 [Anopheles nili]|uniref:testis-specific serine/threonine-protein kinase 3 n=1 Tax=Anopheles nili TaxID=185578 RepID=UPI00237BA876|nr:testis-specific serine/threonine-protein kinase 3 [Anopheles nili]